MAVEVEAFFSYSRDDSEFVDRLEADLRARGFRIWVDRRKLEGGQNWEQEIERAITNFQLFVIVMSPTAVVSPYVRDEYEIALRLGKRIIPIMYKLCAMPNALAEKKLHYIDFTNKSYEAAVKELIHACQDPSLDLTAESTALYNQALALESTNPERAAVLFQRILDRDPGYFGGQAQRDMERLNRRLYPQRAQIMRSQAELARKEGAYGAEAGTLEALIALGDQDPAIQAWAKEYLPIAQQNRALLGPYEVILQRVAASDLAGARERLTELWRQAPYFRDPGGVAPKLGLAEQVPMTYEEARDRRHVGEVRDKQLEDAKRRQDADVAELQADAQGHVTRVSEQSELLSRQIKEWASGQKNAPDRRYLENIERELRAAVSTGDQHTSAHLAQVLSSSQAYVTTRDEAVASHKAERSVYSNIDDVLSFLAFPTAFLIVAIITFKLSNSLIWAIFIGLVLVVPLGWLVLFLISVPLGAILNASYRFVARTVYARRATRLEIQAGSHAWEAKSAGEKLCAALEHERETRIQNFQSERDAAISAIEVQFQQREAEIATEYAQALADIAARYASAKVTS